VGVMLWEAIARQPMHGTASVYEILRRLVQGELPPIRQAVPDVPEPLAKILDRALSLKPEHRYPDAAAFREDLASYLEGRKVSTRAIGERVSLLFAEERREINQVIRCALTEASDEAGSIPVDAVHLLPTLKVLAARASTAQNTGPTTAPSAMPPPQPTTPPPVQMAPLEPPKATGSKARVAAPIGIAAAIVLVLSLVSRMSSKPPVSTLNAAKESSVAGAPGEVRVSIRAHPDSAQLSLDGKPLGKSPYSGTRARDHEKHELIVSAEGFQTRTVNIQLDHDLDLEVGLTETAVSPAAVQAPSASVSTRKDAPLVVARPRAVAPSLPKKGGGAETDPYRDLPARKSAGTKAPPLDTSESPW